MITLKRFLTMDTAKNIYLCLTGAGVVVFMFYCMRIQFFPTGLSLSDVIFFLMVIASFSLFLFFFILCWYSMSIITAKIFMSVALFTLRRTKKPDLLRTLKGTNRMAKLMKIYEPILAHSLISLIGIVIIFLMEPSRKIDAFSIFLSIVMTAFCIILIPNIYYDRKIQKQKKKNLAGLVVGCGLFFFFMLSGIPPVLSDAGMTYIGVRKSNITVMLQGSDLEMARHLTGNLSQVYFKADALFTGVGATSLLVINNKKIVVKNENLSLSL